MNERKKDVEERARETDDLKIVEDTLFCFFLLIRPHSFHDDHWYTNRRQNVNDGGTPLFRCGTEYEEVVVLV